MITVHHLEDSRSQRVLWLLEELGADYEIRRYERDPTTRLAPPDLYEVHPLGKSPVITDGDLTVAETGAIFEYLLESLDSDFTLGAIRGTPEARSITYWLHYAEGTAMPLLLMKLVFGSIPEQAPGLARGLVRRILAPVEDSFLDPRIAEQAAFWNASLAPTGWFSGTRFSAADIMMSFPLEAAATRLDLSPYPHVERFLTACHERPAYQAALRRGGPYAYA